MRKVHRFVAVFAVLFGIYIGSTGTLIQLMDLQALLSRAPASNTTMQAIRVGNDGPPNFQVIREPDYAADPLPADFDFDTALATVVKSARAEINDAPTSFVELRMLDSKPIGQVASQGQIFGFDAASGAALGTPTPLILPPLSLPSLRNTVKDVHRLRVFGQGALVIDVLAGAALCAMIFTGFMVYLQLLRARARMKRQGLFWKAGGWWLTLHRAISVTSAIFLVVVALSGMVLGLSSIGVSINAALHGGKRPGLTADVSAPLVDAELPAMLNTTLTAYRSVSPDTPVKVVRLRYFAGMPQGVIVTGGGDTLQLVFNAATGHAVGQSEPGYPDIDMTFGWQIDQIAKKIHRGDFIGLSGRWIDLLAGLSLLYLSVSGGVIYFSFWSRRRRMGRHGLFWS